MLVVERPAVGHVRAHHPHAAAGGREQPGLGVGRRAVGEARHDVVEADPAQDGDAVPPALAVVRGLVARAAKASAGKARVGQLRLLQADDVGLALGQPLLHPLEPGVEGVDVPGREAHGDRRYRSAEAVHRPVGRTTRTERPPGGAGRHLSLAVALAPLGRLAGGCPLLGAAFLRAGAFLAAAFLRAGAFLAAAFLRAGAFFAAAFFFGRSLLGCSLLAGRSLLGCGLLLAGRSLLRCGLLAGRSLLRCGLLASRSLLRCCLLAAGAFLAAAFFRAGAFLAAAFFFFAGATRASSVSWCTGSLAVPAGTTPGMVRSTPRRGVSNAWTTNEYGVPKLKHLAGAARRRVGEVLEREVAPRAVDST